MEMGTAFEEYVEDTIGSNWDLSGCERIHEKRNIWGNKRK